MVKNGLMRKVRFTSKVYFKVFFWQKQPSKGPKMFLRKDVPEICCKFTGWHSCRSSVISIKLLFICFIRQMTQASLAKYLSVGLRTKWLWVRIPLLSPKLQTRRLLQARSSLAVRQTIECRFTLKLVCYMIITYSRYLFKVSYWSTRIRRGNCSNEDVNGVVLMFTLFKNVNMFHTLF